MLSIKRLFTILLILILAAVFIQFFRIGIIVSTENKHNLNASDVVEITQDIEGKEKYLIVSDIQNETLNRVTENVKRVLQDMKLYYEVLDVNEFKNPSPNYDYHIFVITDLNQLPDVKVLFDFIADGGKVIFPYRLEFSDAFSGVYRFLGITEHGEFESVHGVTFNENIFLNSQDIEPDWTTHLVNSSIAVQLNERSELMMSAENGLSLAWEYPYGLGKITYFNGTMLENKENRAVLSGLINTLRPLQIMPVINSQVHIIEGMPSPIPSGNHDAVFSDYKRSILRFYKEIWWPDMVEMGSRFDHIYTTSLLGTYDVYRNEDLAKYFFLKRENLSLFGREILTSDGEIAMLGFNKFPMVSGEKWQSTDQMINGLKLIEDFFEVVFTEYQMLTFIPINNQLDKVVLTHLKNNNYLTVVSRYFGENGIFTNEFGIRDGYVEHPIVSSGYIPSGEKLWNLINVASFYGNITHSVGFDDVFDEFRSEGLDWKLMYESLYDFYDLIEDHYNWLENVTVSASSKRIITYHNVSPTYSVNGNRVTINSNHKTDDSVYYILHLEKDVNNIYGGNITLLNEHYYLLEATEDVTTIILGR